MNCFCCNTAINNDDAYINCGICGKVFKITCTELSRTEAKRVGSDLGLSWSCKSCRALRNDLLGLKTLIIELQEDIKVLKMASIAPVPTVTETLIKSEEIIQEVLERERRRHNIIVYGVSESKSNSRDERLANDVSSLQDLFRYIGATVPPDVKPVRLGKFDPTKDFSKRPIKISFSSSDLVLPILKKSNILRDSAEHPRTFICADRTPFQQKLYKAVKAELDERKSRGEVNLRIKYTNGIPKIIQSEN